MSRTITVDTGKELLGFIDNLVESGSYKTKSEVVREGLRLLKEQQASSKLEALRQLIDDGENSGDLTEWNVENFLDRMKTKTSDGKK